MLGRMLIGMTHKNSRESLQARYPISFYVEEFILRKNLIFNDFDQVFHHKASHIPIVIENFIQKIIENTLYLKHKHDHFGL